MDTLQSLVEIHPLPWKVLPALSSHDRAFIRDAEGKLVAKDFASTRAANALATLVNEHRGSA